MPPPGVEGEGTEPPREVTYAIVRTMVAAALADGHLAAEEKELVHKRLGESGFTEEETRQIHQDLALPPSPAASPCAVATPSPSSAAATSTPASSPAASRRALLE